MPGTGFESKLVRWDWYCTSELSPVEKWGTGSRSPRTLYESKGLEFDDVRPTLSLILVAF